MSSTLSTTCRQRNGQASQGGPRNRGSRCERRPLLLAVVAGEPRQRQERLGQVVAKAGPDMAAAAVRPQSEPVLAARPGGRSCRRRRRRPAPPAGTARAPRLPARAARRTAPGQSVQAAPSRDRRRRPGRGGQQRIGQFRGRRRDDAAERPRDLVDAGSRQHDGRAARERRLDDDQRDFRDRGPERQQEGVAAGNGPRSAAGASMSTRQSIASRRGLCATRARKRLRHAWPQSGRSSRSSRASRPRAAAVSNASSARSAPRAASGGPR